MSAMLLASWSQQWADHFAHMKLFDIFACLTLLFYMGVLVYVFCLALKTPEPKRVRVQCRRPCCLPPPSRKPNDD